MQFNGKTFLMSPNLRQGKIKSFTIVDSAGTVIGDSEMIIKVHGFSDDENKGFEEFIQDSCDLLEVEYYLMQLYGLSKVTLNGACVDPLDVAENIHNISNLSYETVDEIVFDWFEGPSKAFLYAAA